MGWRETTLEHRGLSLAVQEHGPADGLPVLALHGWQDNAGSFGPLAALLPDLRIIAPDFPGHGRSGWRHPQAGYSIWSYLEELDPLLARFGLDEVVLLGHSMGGAVAALFAALYPERCRRLVLLDTIGPLATRTEDAPEQLREALRQRAAVQLDRRRHYPDLVAAVQARASRGLDPAAALALAERGVRQEAAGCYWHLDPRLGLKNPVSFTEEHSRAFLSGIQCPVLLVAARQFWEGREAWFRQRIGYFRRLQLHELDGGHHQHMEAQAPQVAALVRDFLDGLDP